MISRKSYFSRMVEVSDKYGVQQILLGFKTYGIRHIVISPGSRNAPLSISFYNDSYFTCYGISDERVAAFTALGMADRLNEAVAVVCTSGSAVLNFYPAVAEAFYRNIPLIVLSADRPAELVDQGDGQTIRQQGVLQNHVLGEYHPLELPSEDQQEANQQSINELLELAIDKGGPVHVNMAFHEPLYTTIEIPDQTVVTKERLDSPVVFSDEEQEALVKEWNESPRKMIICGQLPKDKRLQQRLIDLSADSAVIILVENTSNLIHRNFIHCIDRTLNSITDEFKEDFRPDLLITIGGAVISKRIKSYLRLFKPRHHWKIGTHFPEMDTYQCLTSSIELPPAKFFSQLLKWPIKHKLSRYGEQWKQLDYLIQDKHFDYFDTAPYADLTVFNLLLDIIPENSVLHLANSSVIRYGQLFDPVDSIDYYCNRGTSGIDGSTSTAIGAAMVDAETLHTFISGDISFFYDSNAFWSKHLPSNFRMFVINNGGGGIFKIIPGPSTTEALNDHFVAKQNYSAEHICKAFDVNYQAAHTLEEVADQLVDFYGEQKNGRPVVMEIFTPHELNDQVLKGYFKKIEVKPVIFKTT